MGSATESAVPKMEVTVKWHLISTYQEACYRPSYIAMLNHVALEITIFLFSSPLNFKKNGHLGDPWYWSVPGSRHSIARSDGFYS